MSRPSWIVETEEAAAVVGIAPATLWRWVMKGWVRPVDRFSRPLLFNLDDVIAARSKHRTPAEVARLDALAERWRGELPDA